MAATLVDRCDRCMAFLRPMTHEQHAAVEAVYEDLAQHLDWPIGSGQMLEAWDWHQLMVAAFARSQGWTVKVLPALDGKGLDAAYRQKQSRLTKRQGADLIEFAKAWAADHGVHVRAWDEDGNLIAESSGPLRRAA